MLAPRVAAACGQVATPYVTLAESLPAVRTGVPRDGAVVIRGKVWGEAGGPLTFANVRLLDDAGSPIASTSVSWFSAEQSMAYAWATPLPAGTKITVEAVVPEGAVKPAGADGPATTTFVVETGDGLAAPLALAGPLRVQLEAFNADVLRCEGACGGSCAKVGERRALRARIVVPAVTGGVDFDGYRGWLHVTDGQPAAFSGAGEGEHAGLVNGMNWLDVRPGVETEIVQEIFDEDAPYAPCFALNVWDPAGHTVQADPVCLPSLKASSYVRQLDGESGGGCSVAAGGGTGSCLLVTCLAAVSLWRRTSRRRRTPS